MTFHPPHYKPDHFKWAYDGDTGAVSQLMEELRGGGFDISQGALEYLRENFGSGRASEEETRASYVGGVSMRRWVTVEDVAGTVLYLASPAARMISGQVIAIDGNTETMAP